jgi:hypothetical protein
MIFLYNCDTAKEMCQVEEGKQYEFYDCKPGLNVGICLKRDARE